MKYFVYRSVIQLRLTILLIMVVMMGTACSESGKSMSESTVPTRLSGSIFGEDGPVLKANLAATDSQGVVRATSSINGSPRYSLELPIETIFPVVISATYLKEVPKSGGGVESSKEAVKAVVLEPGSSIVDISPRTTTIVNVALARGGFTHENLMQASAAALNMGSGGGSGGHGGH